MVSFRGRRNHASKQTRMAVRFGILVVGLVALSGFTYATGWWSGNSGHDVIGNAGEFTAAESDWQRLLAEVKELHTVWTLLALFLLLEPHQHTLIV